MQTLGNTHTSHNKFQMEARKNLVNLSHKLPAAKSCIPHAFTQELRQKPPDIATALPIYLYIFSKKHQNTGCFMNRSTLSKPYYDK